MPGPEGVERAGEVAGEVAGEAAACTTTADAAARFGTASDARVEPARLSARTAPAAIATPAAATAADGDGTRRGRRTASRGGQ